MNRFISVLVVGAALVSACRSAVDGAAPRSTTTTPTSLTPSTTTTPSTTSTATTTTSTATTTSTTTLPPSLIIEGSPMVRFSVEVGDDVDLDRDDLARFIVGTLSDQRSWIRRGVGFELVAEGGLFTIIVAEPARVDQLCAPLKTNGRFSCARNGWIAFNSLRWFGATDDWPADLETYRRYLVNHEVGHYIVGGGHASCTGAGELAPVMMQQTKGLDGCEANGWVDP
jgi:hypothetical protein